MNNAQIKSGGIFNAVAIGGGATALALSGVFPGDLVFDHSLPDLSGETLVDRGIFSLTGVSAGSNSVLKIIQPSADVILHGAVQAVYADISASQQPLGAEFERVLFSNLSSLYIED